MKAKVFKKFLFAVTSILMVLGGHDLEASMYFPEFLLHTKEYLPPLRTFLARDGEELSYRLYDGVDSDKVMVCLHGSGSHGEYLHGLAKFLSKEMGQVIVPNLRGHFGSGKTPGDCAYIGQLEDDMMDLIQKLHLQGKKIYLLGHSSGGGLAIRLAGSQYSKSFYGYILLAPAIPTAPTMKKESSWADVSTFKIVFLSILNGFGITSFNHSNVISFHMPSEFKNGTETLSYTFNLNTSYHPRIPYEGDVKALDGKYICFVGQEDELMEPAEYKKIMNEDRVKIIANEKHLPIVLNQNVMEAIVEWVKITDTSY
jgi:pimeloyl-ACP methyl ester carboxylesterase